MKLTGAHILCQSLLNEGVEVIFGFPGGKLLTFYDTLPHYPELRHILVRHEQGAAHAADGYARVTGKPGVCLATSGPGATNLVTGIANAHLDSVPMVAITGQVGRQELGKDAFQEADITGITIPITKHNYLIMSAAEIAKAVKEAFYLANTGRPGPVLLDIPVDVFAEKAEFTYPDKVSFPGYKPLLYGHPAQIKKAAKLISEAQKPVIIAGRGVIISKAYAELKELAEKQQIPVITTLLGISSFPETHILSFGMVGMHGAAYANMAVSEADLVIAIGMRFDDRATCRVSGFAPKARIIHIDIDPAEIGKNVRVDVPIVGDARNILQAINKQLVPQLHTDWLHQLEYWKEQHPSTTFVDCDGLMPQFIISKLYEVTKGDAIIVTGVGQNQMWAARNYWYDKPGSFISSGGLGTMGYELPAAIGAKVGRPDETVWTICGDGGFQMTMHELATAVQDNVAIKIAVLNNGYLGMVRQWQQLLYNKRYIATPLSCPDLVKIAEAYGMPGVRVTNKTQVVPVIERAMEHDGPFLIDFRIEPEANIFPFVPPGASLTEFLEDPDLKKMTSNEIANLKMSNF